MSVPSNGLKLIRAAIACTGLCGILIACTSTIPATNDVAGAQDPAQRRAIIFVWDGLRPDSVNATDTPNLLALQREGVSFTDNHATYPTFTMMNGASFATGSFPGTTGFYGNTLWQPGPGGSNSAGQAVDFRQPVFTEDYAILQDLEAFYRNQLFLVGTLFEAAQARGLTTAAIGKSGAAFIQDHRKGGIIFDERTVFPLSLAKELQAAGVPLPSTTPLAYDPGSVTLAADNGNPTAAGAVKRLADGVTSDPTDTSGTPFDKANAYMMDVYLNHILPAKKPDLTLIWFRNPDSTQHLYGVGTANYRDALHSQDRLLGDLQRKLRELGLDATTDIIVVSDHGHSNVSGSLDLFPLRAVAGGTVGATGADGYSVSGDVRTADLLTRAGFVAFDGAGCIYDPVLSGIRADGSRVYPERVDSDGSVCGKAGRKYTTPSYKVPAALPGSHPLVIAANGGSDYVYVPDRDAATVKKVVRFLQSRSEYGAIFVDTGRYGAVPGALPMRLVHLENTAGRNPDIVVSFDFDDAAVIQGVRGIEHESMQGYRGMHGSFSPIDVHNTLIAAGPDFKSAFADTLPSGNVDVTPTVAHVLGLALDHADGRVLTEALRGRDDPRGIAVRDEVIHPEARATGLVVRMPTDPDGKDMDRGKTTYDIELHVKRLEQDNRSYTYFDYAKAFRE